MRRRLLLLLLLLKLLLLLNLLLLLLLLAEGLLFQIQAGDPSKGERLRRVKVSADQDLRRIRRLVNIHLLSVILVVDVCTCSLMFVDSVRHVIYKECSN